MLPIRRIGLSPFNWIDWSDDDPSFQLPEAKYPSSFELPATLWKARQTLRFGTPESADFMSRVQTRRLGASTGSSPTRTTPPQSVGRPESRPAGLPAGKSRRASSASGPDRSRRAHQCPAGHYWSYKHKKCMKSKFR